MVLSMGQKPFNLPLLLFLPRWQSVFLFSCWLALPARGSVFQGAPVNFTLQRFDLSSQTAACGVEGCLLAISCWLWKTSQVFYYNRWETVLAGEQSSPGRETENHLWALQGRKWQKWRLQLGFAKLSPLHNSLQARTCLTSVSPSSESRNVKENGAPELSRAVYLETSWCVKVLLGSQWPSQTLRGGQPVVSWCWGIRHSYVYN